MMKKIVLFTLFAALYLLQSCLGMLDETSKVDIDKRKYMKTAAEAESVLLGVYSGASTDGMYAYNLSMVFSITSDIAQCEGNGTNNIREVPTNSFKATNTDIQLTWKSIYAAIFNANDFIDIATERMAIFPDSERKVVEVYIAEAKALRALYYFELVRLYGNISLITSPSYSYLPADKYEQSTPVRVYEQIESDLLQASKVLPWSTADNIRKKTSYRFSKGAALGLLAKVYATWAGYPVCDVSKWEDAALAAGEVVNSGKHSLLPNFATLWSNTCNGIWAPQESLIEISFYNLTSGTPAGRIGKFNGVKADAVAGQRGANGAYVKVVYSFIEQWAKQNDPRYALSVADYQYKGRDKILYSKRPVAEAGLDPKNWQVCTPAKWDTEKYVGGANYLIDGNYSNINWYVLRYSDVLLLYAEAMNEWKSTPTTEAFEAVNKVRRRGFGFDQNTPNATVDLNPTLGYIEFSNAVRGERAYELCFEGHRRADLVRWGIYYDKIVETANTLASWYGEANYAALRYTVKGKHEIFPIPQRDLDLMTKFKQNPGWTQN